MSRTDSELDRIEQAIARSRPETQRQLLRDLPRLLKMKAEDMALLLNAQPAFDFWDNPDDEVYDQM